MLFRSTRESLSDVLGFSSTPNIGKYLGIPLKVPGDSSNEFNFILDRVKQKLASWKANLLSLARRNMLIQASTAAIPSYVMQCNLLPRRILDGIDRVNRNFLWGTTESTRKMHWVRWQKVTKPKEDEGLGLQTARGRNIAMLAKLNWRLNIEREASWAKVLQAKYCNNKRLNAANVDKLPCSRIWKAIKKGREFLLKGVCGW